MDGSESGSPASLSCTRVRGVRAEDLRSGSAILLQLGPRAATAIPEGSLLAKTLLLRP